METAYLDHAATTPLRAEALEAMLPYLKEGFGNPSSVHPLGLAAREAVEKARAQVAALIGASVSEIVFTSGATEANNLAIRGTLGDGSHAVTTNIEHPSVAETFKALAQRGVETTVVGAGKDGVVNAADILAAVRPETKLVSVMWVNNELGTIQPIMDIAAGLAKLSPRPLFHVDAVQAAPSIAVDVKKAGIDLLSLSAHKLGGPKGVGALFVRKGLKPSPILTGGGQESGLRSGTENVAGIVGFGEAARLRKEEGGRTTERMQALQAALDAALSDEGVGAKRLLAAGTPVAPHIAALECPDADADYLVLLLGQAGAAVSAGSACHAGSRETSRILAAIDVSDARARTVIRVSFGPETSGREIGFFAKKMKEALGRASASFTRRKA